MKNNYVYIYLDPRKPGKWEYKGFVFDYCPFYVGRGVGSRFLHHTNRFEMNRETLKTKIIRKIKQKNLFPIRFKIFENLIKSESEEIEIDMIAHFGRICLNKKTNPKIGILANIDEGGAGKNRVVSEETRKKKGATNRGSLNCNSKSVLQLDMYGNLIKKWGSIAEAARGNNISESSISAVLNGRTTSCHGFKWQCDGTLYSPKAKEIRSHNKTVYSYNQDGTFYRKYESVSIAAQENHISVPSISGYIHSKSASFAGNFYTLEDHGPHLDTSLYKIKQKSYQKT